MGSCHRPSPSSARVGVLVRARVGGRHHARRGRTAVVATVLAAAVSLVGGPLTALPAGGFPSPADQPTVAAAAAWLKTQQQPDGGFEVAGFPGFETPDAVLALAEAAHAVPGWDATTARAAVAAVTVGGLDAFDALDAYAAGALDTGQAAKLIMLVAAPFDFDPSAFDPAGDGAPVDLVAVVRAGANPDGTYGSPAAFTQTLYAALALYLVDGSVPAPTVAAVADRQQANGGWNFSGDASGTDSDPDTTSLAIQALVAGGQSASDPAVAAALGFLADSQQPDGSWASPFDSGNPNSTAMAMLGVAATGFSPADPGWRDLARPALAGTPYVAPAPYLRSLQAPDGHLASPNDGFGLNTFATSQGIEALSGGWLPVRAAEAPAVPPLVPEVPAVPSVPAGPGAGPGSVGSAPAAVPVTVAPSFTG